MKVLCIYFLNRNATQELAEVFYRYTPQICGRGDHAIFLEISRCEKLYSVESLSARLKVLLKKMDVPACMAVASDPPTALARARFQMEEKMDLPLAALEYYATPLVSDPFLQKKIVRMIEVLQVLGLTRLQDFMDLPLKTLSGRFGALGLQMRRNIEDATGIPWPLFKPREQIVECCQIEYELRVDNFESIYFWMKSLVDRMVLRLRARGECVRTFRLQLDLEPHSQLKQKEFILDFHLYEPSVKVKSILTILRERLQTELDRRPLESPIIGMEILVQESLPWRGSQQSFLDPQSEERREQESGLFQRLRQRLGEESFFKTRLRSSYRPELAWEKVALQNISASQSPRVPQRPLRLLPSPLPLVWQSQQQQLGYEQGRGRWGRNSQCFLFKRILRVDHQEVLSGDLWSQPFERRYFVMEMEDYEKWWVFKEGGRFFLHGVFD